MAPRYTGPRHDGWILVVPYKGTRAAKSRLSIQHDRHLAIDDDLRPHLARAFLLDTVSTAISTSCVAQVIVVSGDPSIAMHLPEATILPDPCLGLNAAISAGLSQARLHYPDAPRAILTGDLPGLRADDLRYALQLAETNPLGVVADHAGTGTTTLTELPGQQMLPRFGPDSFLKHLQSGHQNLSISMKSTLRQDVDTPQDFHQALRLGVGKATAEAVASYYGSHQRLELLLERTP